jgi:prepilin-type N-terminal cleavage/methylation domain-containing protein
MKSNRRGFSLIELLIVVALLGIISAIAVPMYMGVQKRGKRVEYKANLEIIKLLEEKRRAEQGRYIDAVDTAALMLALPDFQPGDPAALLYEYTVTCTDPQLDFTATAEGKAGTPDAGKKFCIDQNNQKYEDALCP